MLGFIIVCGQELYFNLAKDKCKLKNFLPKQDDDGADNADAAEETKLRRRQSISKQMQEMAAVGKNL